jgi:hypothetical protein
MNYIPTKETDFIEWSENLITVSIAHKDEWNLSQSKLDELLALHNEVKTLHQLCQTSSFTKLDMQAKNEKKAELLHLEKVIERNNLHNNDAMTDNGRQELRIPIYDKTPSPHPAPDTLPDVEIDTPFPRVVQIKFRAINAPRWGKPKYVHGLECLWVIADTAPAKIEDLLHSSFATHSPLDLTFDEDQRGKRLYFAVRWESGTVKKGPWSDIYSAIIP